uniref:G protein-coupled receptor n=1 Tax=Steinernema glaseri TaxID=37863 RepID=A0A1I7ZMU9_9BILA
MLLEDVTAWTQVISRVGILFITSTSLFVYWRRPGPPKKSRFTTLTAVFITHLFCALYVALYYSFVLLRCTWGYSSYVMAMATPVCDFMVSMSCAILTLDRIFVLAAPAQYTHWKVSFKLGIATLLFDIALFSVANGIPQFFLSYQRLIYLLSILAFAYSVAMALETILYVVLLIALWRFYTNKSNAISRDNKQLIYVVLFQAVIHTGLATVPVAANRLMFCFGVDTEVFITVVYLAFDSSSVSLLLIAVFTLYQLLPKKSTKVTSFKS